MASKSTFDPGRHGSSQQREKTFDARLPHMFSVNNQIYNSVQVETLDEREAEMVQLVAIFSSGLWLHSTAQVQVLCVLPLFFLLADNKRHYRPPQWGSIKALFHWTAFKKGGVGGTDCRSMLMCLPIKLIFDWGHGGQVAWGWSP